MQPYDRIDSKLLALLQKDARRSNKELAASVGLAPSSCFERVKRLRASGVITGFHAALDPERAGIGLQALITIRQSTDYAETAAFVAHVRSFEEVVGIFEVGGADDFILHVAVRNSSHLRELVYERIQPLPEVIRTETNIVFRHESQQLPLYAGS